ncbi:NADPH-dependent FMN reductase [Proteiniborus ethanoligenes]|uniref:NADPH-dependent FMN reductase n=1 Tax=Proteiniborus ethanoligenes TaxID=415015 RepID=A0A1H3PXL1_9FIRM|nr:flavodoxin family protein [Proteiniborus ethanoligenes]TAH63960.1 MAG: flavodoxin family protein [Gottschalkiaceae bacterium]SDZ05826.1 NADPH-dependent FMN reductase [Proteiniborus ethanoligenes]
MKKVLAIMGSQRKNKNTDRLLDAVLEGVRTNRVEIKKVYLNDMDMSLCKACAVCEKTGKCFIKDDMTDIYDDFNHSDIIIIASPLYFNTVSSLTKIMIDRCQVYWSSKYVLKNPSIDRNKKRVGMFISVGGAPERKEHFDACIPVMDLFFKAINTEYKYNLFSSNTDEIPVWERQDILEIAFEKGKELVL